MDLAPRPERLAQPLADILLKETGRRFIYTNLTEVFFTQVKVAFFGAACLAHRINVLGMKS